MAKALHELGSRPQRNQPNAGRRRFHMLSNLTCPCEADRHDMQCRKVQTDADRFVTGLPDSRMDVTAIIESGDRVVVEGVYSGHTPNRWQRLKESCRQVIACCVSVCATSSRLQAGASHKSTCTTIR